LALIAAIVFIATIVRSPSRTNPTGTDQTKPVALKLIPAALSGQANGASLQPAAGAETTRTDPNDTSRQVSALEALNWCCAAALGAAFYVLFQAQEYVTKRTFDPQYNSVYVIRLVLGILAGFILAYVTQSTGLLKGQLKDYGPPVIALLGGFSTDAVNQVLQRLVEIVMAAIRGDGSQAAKTKANQTAQSELLSLAGDPSVASNQPVLNKIHAAVTKLSQ
jgi:hypothetical protein